MVTAFVERVFLFLEDGEWNKASEYCERILDVDPKNAYAYLGKLMVELRIKQKSDLSTCKKDFEQDTNYKRIIQFGDPTITAETEGYLAQVKRNLEAENNRRKQTNERTRRKSIKILRIILSIILIVTIICGGYFFFVPNKTNKVIKENPITYLDYKGLSIATPIRETVTLTTDGKKIYLQFNGTISNFTIIDFLKCVKPPEGTRFYATGWAQRNSLSFSFLIKDYMEVGIPYAAKNPLTGEAEWKFQTKKVDLQIYSINGKLENRIMNGDSPPLFYGPAHNNNGILSTTTPNDGTMNYPFKQGETTIIAQYKSPDTTVEIVVVK